MCYNLLDGKFSLRRNIIFEIGDSVVHPVHGAGIVKREKKFQLGGSEKHYLCVELRDSHNTEVMLPINDLEKIGLRKAFCDFDMVRALMFEPPRVLDDDYRTRQSNIQKRIDEDGVEQLVQGIRDLYWYEHCDKLTSTDKKLRTHLQKRLARELSVIHEFTRAKTKERLNQIIEQAMTKHAQLLDTATVN